MSEVPNTPWQRVQQGRRARKSEEAGAKKLGGRRQPASGAKWFAKGDIRANGILWDDKFTEIHNGELAKSYRIERDVFLKLIHDAATTPPGLRPGLRIHIPGLPTLALIIEDDLLYYMAVKAEAEDGPED